MDASPFDYLTILVSLVLGLGIADLLQSAYRLIQGQAHIRFHWLALAWAVVVFLKGTFFFWDFYALRHNASWSSFPAFLYLLSVPILLFLASRNALPDVVPDTLPGASQALDLEAYYFDRPRGFFVILALSSLAHAGITFFLDPGMFLSPGSAGYRPFLFLGEVVVFSGLAWTRSRRFHTVATVAVFVVTLVFVFVIQSPLTTVPARP